MPTLCAVQADKPGVKDLFLSAMDALSALDPDTIMFINGAGQAGYGINWGNGFVTDATLIAQYGLSDPNPFFTALLAKPYRSKVGGASVPGGVVWCFVYVGFRF
jgi:hypothetical protein